MMHSSVSNMVKSYLVAEWASYLCLNSEQCNQYGTHHNFRIKLQTTCLAIRMRNFYKTVTGGRIHLSSLAIVQAKMVACSEI